MSTVTNKLEASAFVSNPVIQVVPLSTSPIQWELESSAEIRLVVHKPVKTPNLRKPSSVTILSIPRNSEIVGWHLKSLLLVQINHTQKESVATTWLEGIAEYGVAKNESGAIIDLVVSLGEYLEALERREKNLGDSARKELNYLRRLIGRSQTGSSSR